MSMSTDVKGFIPPDEDWQRMKAAWDSCVMAGVAVPAEVEAFFGGEEPDPSGLEVDLPVRAWNGGERGAGYELDAAAIPPQVKIIRFWNSW